MWIKRNGKYQLNNNNVDTRYFLENEKKINSKNKSTIYIPTHNINDVYEWYRIFNDSYAYSSNYNKLGWGIHAYFSKERGESIEGYFPNLIEVKATTSDQQINYIQNNRFFKRSKDYISNFNQLPELFIDDVEIFENEIVLIKNQEYKELLLFTVNQSLSQNQIYIEIQNNEQQYFKENSEVVIRTIDNQFLRNYILNINYDTVLGDNYIVITLKNNIDLSIIDKLADIENGLWIDTSEAGQNGVYMYFNKTLIPIQEMFDKHRMHNKIVYTYLGKTNQNCEFYLRPIENKFSSNYGLYPYLGLGEPLIYSKGNAHLIEAEIEYNLAIEDNSNIINPNCCTCTVSMSNPDIPHPTTPPPYDIESTAFRMLFLDNSVAERIFSSYSGGVGEYKLNTPIQLLDGTNSIDFTINNQILESLYYNYTGTPINTDFVGINSPGGLTSFKSQFTDYTINNLQITQLPDYTRLNLTYDSNSYVFSGEILVGDFIKLKIIKNNIILLDHTFVLNAVTLDPNYIELEIFQKLDDNIVNEIIDTDVIIEIETINAYPVLGSGISITPTFNINSDSTSVMKIVGNYLFKITNVGFDILDVDTLNIVYTYQPATIININITNFSYNSSLNRMYLSGNFFGNFMLYFDLNTMSMVSKVIPIFQYGPIFNFSLPKHFVYNEFNDKVYAVKPLNGAANVIYVFDTDLNYLETLSVSGTGTLINTQISINPLNGDIIIPTLNGTDAYLEIIDVNHNYINEYLYSNNSLHIKIHWDSVNNRFIFIDYLSGIYTLDWIGVSNYSLGANVITSPDIVYDLSENQTVFTYTIYDGTDYLIYQLNNDLSSTLIDTYNLGDPGLETSFIYHNDSYYLSYLGVLYKYDIVNNFLINSQRLLEHINKSIIGQIYEFSIENQILTFEKIRQNTKFKYLDHFCTIEYDSIQYYIDSTILSNYRQYFYGYKIEDYLTNYLGLSSDLQFNQLEQVQFTYEDNILSDDRFDIFGSNKISGMGNIIRYGRNNRDLVLDKLKPQTFVKFTYSSTADIEDVFIYKIEWDEENNYGTIYLNDYITRPAANGEIINIIPYTDLTDVSNKIKTVLDKKINSITEPNYSFTNTYKMNTMSYAHAMMNYADTLTGQKDEILNNITALFYKDYNESRISFLKRDRKFNFDDDLRIDVSCASIGNIDLLNVPATIDGYNLQIDDLVVLKDQTDVSENGVYAFDGVDLIRYADFNRNNYWIVQNGTQIGQSYVAYYELPFLIGSTPVMFVNKNFKTKKDPRLSITFKAICKLGVDNLTQPWKTINTKYDVLETSENQLSVGVGVNASTQIRFIDGLTEHNIINDIDGQGQYAWILNENVITSDAVVGCTQSNGPGTGELVWYTGTWIQGTWCDGIWIQGTWLNGTWLNGKVYSYPIQDYYSFVTYTPVYDIQLTSFENCIWYNGEFNGGKVQFIEWHNGTLNDGEVLDAIWYNGTVNNALIKHIHWYYGTLNGGIIETGVWEDGNFNNIDPNIPSIFGIGALSSGSFKDRAIWRTGRFTGGDFYSGATNTDHSLSIFYSGEFSGGRFNGGTFVSGVFNNATFNNGVSIGGYKITITNETADKKLITIDPAQYDSLIGLDVLLDYEPNQKHNLAKYQSNFILWADVDVPVNQIATDLTYINKFFDNTPALSYQTKPYVSGSSTDTEMLLDITIFDIDSTYLLNGDPMILSEFYGTFKDGIFMHGYFGNGIFENGIILNGFWNNGTFGLI